MLDAAGKPKTFTKQVRGSDYIILDISQFNCNLEEADAVIKALKYTDSAPEKEQVLIVVSSPMSWSQTPPKPENAAYTEDEYQSRIPVPSYLIQK